LEQGSGSVLALLLVEEYFWSDKVMKQLVGAGDLQCAWLVVTGKVFSCFVLLAYNKMRS
jgi:hypothetical protein